MDFSALFASALSPFYASACLHRAQRSDDGKGGFAITFVDRPVQAILDPAAAGVDTPGGHPDTTVQIMVLRHGVSSPDIDDEITLHGTRYAIAGIQADPLQAGWVLRCTTAS